MLDLRLIATFIKAAGSDSFSEAGRTLDLTPAAVSQNIKHLEAQLGVRLFTRTTRHVRLTPEGSRFLARCGPSLAALDDAVRAVTDEAERIEGRIRVSATTSFGRHFLIPLVVRFMAEHPKVAVEIDLSDRFVDLVAEEFDLAIRVGHMPENEYVARMLLATTPTLVASPTYLERSSVPRSLDELAAHRSIGMLSNTERRVFAWEFTIDGKGVRREVSADLVINESEAVTIAAAAGHGIAQVGSHLAAAWIARGELVPLLADCAPLDRGICAVYPTRRYTPHRTSAFIEFISENLSAIGGR